MIKGYVNRVSFSQNRSLFSGVITNLIDLLYWLRKKSVAIRDLKPDNLFIVGDITKSPFMLARAEDYSMGLIDFETAVCYEPNQNNGFVQPMLACTPSYATPSHLFANDLLTSVYPDLTRILHLQDWQAVIGMIFTIVTGERLFDKTRKKLSEIRNVLRASSLQKKTLADAYKICCCQFWKSAAFEFRDKAVRYEKKLKSVECAININIRSMLREEVEKARSATVNEMKQIILSQQWFKSDKARRDLLRSSQAAISRCKINWQNNINVPAARPGIRNQIVWFLSDLENRKADYEEQIQWLDRLSAENPKLTSCDLLQIMFKTVYKGMYKEEWEQLVSDVSGIIVPLKHRNDQEEPVSDQEAVAFEKTISYE
jgi:serine/threonine protein kinase